MFVCIVEAIAGGAKDFRPGARHVMLILLSAERSTDATRDAGKFVEEAGWLHAEIKQIAPIIEAPDLVDHETLSEAIEVARIRGHCIAVDLEEVPLDS